MNINNCHQVSLHLCRLIKTDNQLQTIIRELNSKRSQAIGRFSGIIEINSFGQFIVPYFEQYASDKDRKTDGLFDTSLGEKIAFAMRDADAPFSKSEVMAFCSFFEIDSKEMMKQAVADEIFFQWANEERRMNDY